MKPSQARLSFREGALQRRMIASYRNNTTTVPDWMREGRENLCGAIKGVGKQRFVPIPIQYTLPPMWQAPHGIRASFTYTRLGYVK